MSRPQKRTRAPRRDYKKNRRIITYYQENVVEKII